MQHLWPFRVAFHYALALLVEQRYKGAPYGESYFKAGADRLLKGEKVSLREHLNGVGPNPYIGEMTRHFSFVFQQMFRRSATDEELDELFTPEWRDEF